MTFNRTVKLRHLALALVALPAGALADTPDDGKGRYALQVVDGGVLRLDKETGAMALCTRKAEQWACEAVQDRSKDDSEKSAKLDDENKQLKDRIKVLEDSLAIAEGANKADKPDTAPGGNVQLPTEQEVDKAFDYVERIIKKFRERVQKYGEANDPTKPDAAPRPDASPQTSPETSPESKPL